MKKVGIGLMAVVFALAMVAFTTPKSATLTTDYHFAITITPGSGDFSALMSVTSAETQFCKLIFNGVDCKYGWLPEHLNFEGEVPVSVKNQPGTSTPYPPDVILKEDE